MVKEGYNTWFFLTADYAFGHDLEKITAGVVKATAARYRQRQRSDQHVGLLLLLQAQTSKAKVIGLANAGADTTNSIKQAAEFGIVQGGQNWPGCWSSSTTSTASAYRRRKACC